MVTRRPRGLAPVLCVLLALPGCAPAPRPPPGLPTLALPGSDGAPHRLDLIARGAPFTVVTFFSASCPCQRAHDARLLDLSARYGPRGVAFVSVDAEATASLALDRDEARARRYPFPLLTDAGGAAADALGATWATYTVVVDSAGRVRYRGGIDSDKQWLSDGATLWLRDALDRLLAGGDPDPAETEPLGCALRRR
jgi:hypothetical protein